MDVELYILYNSTSMVCLSMLNLAKLLVAILPRSSRDMLLKLFVLTESPSCHDFAAQFSLAFFYTRKIPKKTIANTGSRALVYRKGLIGLFSKNMVRILIRVPGVPSPEVERARFRALRSFPPFLSLCFCCHGLACPKEVAVV